MTNEEFLLKVIQQCADGLEMNMRIIKEQKSLQSIDYDIGQMAGIQQALGAINASIRLYDRKVKGTLPQEMIENMKAGAPTLWRLLHAMAYTPDQQKRNTEKNPDKVSLH